MQIEDKNVLNSLSDSVLVATSRLNLAPSILFQIKCMNILEDLIKIKNVKNKHSKIIYNLIYI
jgi:hypothetical protein